MKKIFTVAFIVISFLTFGQPNKQKTLSTFIISDAILNGTDNTETYLFEEAYTVFYTEGSNLCMANVWNKSKTQSYGRLYATKHKKLKASYESYEADIYFFKWRYINSYDSKKGTADIEFIKIYKPQGVTFKITIIPENLDMMVFRGYMEGTLDFSVFSN